MLHSTKNSNNTNAKSKYSERRKNIDRRSIKSKAHFPLIDENCKLVMKDRRVAERRESSGKIKNSYLTAVKGLFKN